MDHSSSHTFSDNAEKEKFAIDAAEFPINGTAQLPESYGDNRLVILPRDPHWFFAYWEFTADRARQLTDDQGHPVWDRGTLVLRVYDLSAGEPRGIEGSPFFDIDVTPREARKWYVHVERSGHSYLCELGIRLPDGRFFALLRSNRIRLPVGRVSDKTDSEWMAVGESPDQQDERFKKLAEGVEQINRSGSAEFAKGMAQRWEFLKSVFSGSSPALSSGQFMASVGTPSEEEPKP